MSIDDYGPHAGDGTRFAHLPERRVEAGIKRGREADFVAFLSAQTDEGTRRLVAEVGHRGFRTPEFTTALAEWVRERDAIGLAIPESVAWQRKIA